MPALRKTLEDLEQKLAMDITSEQMEKTVRYVTSMQEGTIPW
jgi:hypothetical protein